MEEQYERFTDRQVQVIHGLRTKRQAQYHDDVFAKSLTTKPWHAMLT